MNDNDGSEVSILLTEDFPFKRIAPRLPMTFRTTCCSYNIALSKLSFQQGKDKKNPSKWGF